MLSIETLKWLDAKLAEVQGELRLRGYVDEGEAITQVATVEDLQKRNGNVGPQWKKFEHYERELRCEFSTTENVLPPL